MHDYNQPMRLSHVQPIAATIIQGASPSPTNDSYLVSTHQLQRMQQGESVWQILESLEPVDQLPGYNQQMFRILEDFLVTECRFGLGHAGEQFWNWNLEGVSASVTWANYHDARVAHTRLAGVVSRHIAAVR